MSGGKNSIANERFLAAIFRAAYAAVCLGLIFWAAFSGKARANVVGADTQNFNPITSGLDFVTVHSSETLKPGLLNFGLFLNYAVNSLPNYEDYTTSSRTNFSDALFSADFNVGMGLMKNWDVGASFPVLLNQEVDSDLGTYRGEYANTGLIEYRFNTKYRFIGNQDYGVGTVLSVNFNQIQDNPFAGDDPGPTFNVELVGDQTFGRWAVGANVGYRFRNPGTPIPGIPVEPLGNQWIASTAGSYLLMDYDIKIIAELFGSFPSESSAFASDRDLSTLEFLAGLKSDLGPQLAWHVGAGTEVLHGTASPDWRLYTGINWVIGPVFSKPYEPIVRVGKDPLLALEENLQEDPFDGEPEVEESFIGRDIMFAFDSSEVKPEFRQALERLADYLRRPPGFKSLVIEGHTDSIGSADYNNQLSLRRSTAVKKVLLSMGLPASKVRAVGWGEFKPIADNGNYQGRSLNRRVEFKVSR